MKTFVVVTVLLVAIGLSYCESQDVHNNKNSGEGKSAASNNKNEFSSKNSQGRGEGGGGNIKSNFRQGYNIRSQNIGQSFDRGAAAAFHKPTLPPALAFHPLPTVITRPAVAHPVPLAPPAPSAQPEEVDVSEHVSAGVAESDAIPRPVPLPVPPQMLYQPYQPVPYPVSQPYAVPYQFPQPVAFAQPVFIMSNGNPAYSPYGYNYANDGAYNNYVAGGYNYGAEGNYVRGVNPYGSQQGSVAYVGGYGNGYGAQTAYNGNAGQQLKNGLVSDSPYKAPIGYSSSPVEANPGYPGYAYNNGVQYVFPHAGVNGKQGYYTSYQVPANQINVNNYKNEGKVFSAAFPNNYSNDYSAAAKVENTERANVYDSSSYSTTSSSKL